MAKSGGTITKKVLRELLQDKFHGKFNNIDELMTMIRTSVFFFLPPHAFAVAWRLQAESLTHRLRHVGQVPARREALTIMAYKVRIFLFEHHEPAASGTSPRGETHLNVPAWFQFVKDEIWTWPNSAWLDNLIRSRSSRLRS